MATQQSIKPDDAALRREHRDRLCLLLQDLAASASILYTAATSEAAEVSPEALRNFAWAMERRCDDAIERFGGSYGEPTRFDPAQAEPAGEASAADREDDAARGKSAVGLFDEITEAHQRIRAIGSSMVFAADADTTLPDLICELAEKAEKLSGELYGLAKA